MSNSLYDSFATIYDLQHGTFDDDMPLYLRLAKEHAGAKPILELGCGTGRAMLPLVKAGYRVVGVDESEAMLAIARQKMSDFLKTSDICKLIQADTRQLELDERFGLAFIALNTFLHNLTREDQLATLRSVHRHLLTDAVLVIDLPANDELSYQPDDGEFVFETVLIDPKNRARIDKYVASKIFWATQEQELTYRIVEENDGEKREQFVSFRLRHVFKHEMELLLLQSGFDTPTWRGDYDLKPYTDGSPRMIAVARKGL
jgi:SAM-dependent methyltransferase